MPKQENIWFSGPAVTVSFRPEVNGYAMIDVVNFSWPDSMGDPKTDPLKFAAWSMGHFGPLAYPGGLERASQHAYRWKGANVLARSHRGFIRIRMSYAFGAKDDDPVFPKDCDPAAEMVFLSGLVVAVADIPGVTGYFNSNGEVLSDTASFCSVFDKCRKQNNVPLLLWMNVRMFNLNETFLFMDTVGNGQMDVCDVEAIFPKDDHEPAVVEYYLRNVTHYLLELGRELVTGELIDGPNETNLSWTIEVTDKSAVAPPRRVTRLYPKSERAQIAKALEAVKSK